jgi:hypothetical protein
MIGIVLGADKQLFVALETAAHLSSLLTLLVTAPSTGAAGLKSQLDSPEREPFVLTMDPLIDSVPVESLGCTLRPYVERRPIKRRTRSSDAPASHKAAATPVGVSQRTWETVTRLASMSAATSSLPTPDPVDRAQVCLLCICVWLASEFSNSADC